MRATSSIREPGPTPRNFGEHRRLNEEHPTLKAIETLIEAGDQLMAAVGKLRGCDPQFPKSPLAAVLDKVLDARSTLMKQRDAMKKGKAVTA